MGIGKVLSAIPEMAGKCRVMSHRKVVQSCLSVGEDLIRTAKENGGHLTIEQLNKAYERFLPKGSGIKAVNDPQELGAFLRNMHFDEDTVSFIQQCAQAGVIKNLKGETLFFLPIEKFVGDKAVNAGTHELEHVLNGENTVSAKKEKIIVKVLGPKLTEKLALKDAEALNVKIQNLQQDLYGKKLGISDPANGVCSQTADAKGLLEYMGLSSQRRLDVQLRQSVRKILDPQSERKNVKYLKAIRHILSDESRAYRAGGQTAHKYLELTEGSSTMSEMVSQIYDETVGVIKKEIKTQRKKGIKRAFGMKVRNYEGKNPAKYAKYTSHTEEVSDYELPPDILEKFKKSMSEGKVKYWDLSEE